MAKEASEATLNRYAKIIERVFLSHYGTGDTEVSFDREEMANVAHELGIRLPSNIGDVIYTFRYRGRLPDSITSRAPEGMSWIIRPAGKGRYRFVATSLAVIVPRTPMVEIKVPDATPGVIAMYAMNDEQALLARIRYNRLIDIFTRTACYSLQSHLRTTVPGMGQVETDEIYVGVHQGGAHYVFPVQAKGGKDTLSIVQIEQDAALCAAKFPGLICRPIGAQFMPDGAIALFSFDEASDGIALSSERHYRLVPPAQMTQADLDGYRREAD